MKDTCKEKNVLVLSLIVSTALKSRSDIGLIFSVASSMSTMLSASVSMSSIMFTHCV